jgi:hypothetical protein
MNRRRFLELLGMATVGSAVAYSFPKVIVPKNVIKPVGFTEAVNDGYIFSGYSPSITFKQLEESYRRACVGKAKPDLIMVSPTTYAQIVSRIAIQDRFIGENNGLVFHGSEIKPSIYVPDNEIITTTNYVRPLSNSRKFS